MSIKEKIHRKSGWTLFELLASVFIIGVPFGIGGNVARSFGIWAGIGAGVFSAVMCITVVVFFYRVSSRRFEQRRRNLREKYRGIYRVVVLPTDASKILKPKGAEIKVGDYGWEAKPIHNDGLIYLQGLTVKWHVVWYVGFHPNQIERIDSKPISQYDWNYAWVSNPPVCPFPIEERKTTAMGFPTLH